MTTTRKPSTRVAAGLLSAAVLTVALGVAPVSTSAGAETPTPGGTEAPKPVVTRDLPAEKVRCTAAIDVLLDALAKLNHRLREANTTTEAHRATQTASNTAAISGLSSLKTKIAADTDRATLGADCKSITTDFRVFALRAPQTHLVIAGDGATFAVSKLNKVVPKLRDAINKAAATGKVVTVARAALSDLQDKLADAASHANGVADAVIVFTPANYNADHSLLSGPRIKVRIAAADLKAARTDIKTILTAIKV